MRKTDKIPLLLIILILSAATAQATPITINITATVGQVDDALNQLNGQIHVNDTITGSYTYESTTADSSLDNPVQGNYWHYSSPAGVSLTVGGFEFKTNPANVEFNMFTRDNLPEDRYGFVSYKNLSLSNGTLVGNIYWVLINSTGTVLSSDALPTTAPIPTQWQSNNLNIYGQGPDAFFISADVTLAQIIPEPTTFLLFALGSLLLKKRRHSLN